MRCETSSALISPTSPEMSLAFDQLSEMEKTPNLQFKSNLRPTFLSILSMFIVGLSYASDMVSNGATYHFWSKPPCFGPNEFPHLENEELTTVLNDAIKWVKKGKFLGPFSRDTTHFNGQPLHFLRGFCIKKDPFILDGVKQYRGLINGSPFSPYFYLYYDSFWTKADFMTALYKQQFMWKLDLLHGFKQCPVSTESLQYNAIRIANWVFVDASSGMGISPSPKHCNALLRAFIRILIFFWPHLFLKSDMTSARIGGFMDDIICGAPTLALAFSQISAALFLGHLLGFEFKPSKIVWPTTSATAIGLLPDLSTQRVSVKPGKLNTFVQSIRKMLGLKVWTLHMLQILSGNWIWISQVIPQLFPIITAIAELMKIAINAPDERILIATRNQEISASVLCLKRYLRMALLIIHKAKPVKIGYFIKALPPAEYCIVSDASTTFGVGGYFGTKFAWQWNLKQVSLFLKQLPWGHLVVVDIAFLEYLAAIITEQIACQRIADHCAIQLIDSVVALGWLKNLRTKRLNLENFHMSILTRRVTLNYCVRTERIPGIFNRIADHLSRERVRDVGVNGVKLKVFTPNIEDTARSLLSFLPEFKVV